MRPRRASGILHRELPDGETVLLGPDGAQAIVLNATGGVVWDLCDGARELEEIAALIAGSLSCPDEATVLADVRALVERLLEAGLLEQA